MDEIYPFLEKDCPACKGTEYVSEYQDPNYPGMGIRPCGCYHGKVPTAFGDAVLDFVKRWLYITQQTRIDVVGK